MQAAGLAPLAMAAAALGAWLLSGCAGFEPLDVLQGVQMILKQLADGRCEVENQYTRVVRREGNERAVAAITETMEKSSGTWRSAARSALSSPVRAFKKVR